MRTVRITMSAAVLLLLACSEAGGPLSPESAVVATDRQASAASMTSGSGVFTFEGPVTTEYECLDEPTYAVVSAPYRYRFLTTPKGDELYVEHWDKKAITGTLTGLVTGTVWTRIDNVSPMVIRTAGGGMMHWTFRGTFVSETGPTLEFREVFHVSHDANGVLRVDRFKFNCWAK